MELSIYKPSWVLIFLVGILKISLWDQIVDNSVIGPLYPLAWGVQEFEFSEETYALRLRYTSSNTEDGCWQSVSVNSRKFPQLEVDVNIRSYWYSHDIEESNLELYLKLNEDQFLVVKNFSMNETLTISHSDYTEQNSYGEIFTYFVVPRVEIPEIAEIQLTGVEPESKSTPVYVTILVVWGFVFAIVLVTVLAKVVYNHYKNKKPQVHSEVKGLKNVIQHQDSHVDQQSVDFEQIACYNNYLMSITPNHGSFKKSSGFVDSQIHTGNLIKFHIQRKSEKNFDELKKLSLWGLVDIERVNKYKLKSEQDHSNI